MDSSLEFSLHECRFEFRARAHIVFPFGEPGNQFRGSFGMALRRTAPPEVYRRVFEPVAEGGPSGFHDAPRPFVFRVAHLRDVSLERGEAFHAGVNLFDAANPPVVEFAQALAHAGRSRMELTGFRHERVTLDLGAADNATGARVRFLTPTELKVQGKASTSPEFGALIRRVRDRVSLLRSLYGAGPAGIDFSAFGAQADGVRIEMQDLEQLIVSRTSGRTGQTHAIGGFRGEVRYAGQLGPFLPFLRAAFYTGVGRHTVWGNGQVQVVQTESR